MPLKRAPRRGSGDGSDRIRYQCPVALFGPRRSCAIPRRNRDHYPRTEDEPGFVRLVTILEVVRVLKSYSSAPDRKSQTISKWCSRPVPSRFNDEQEVYHAVVALRNGTGTFEDALICALGVWRGCFTTRTFDEKAAQN